MGVFRMHIYIMVICLIDVETNMIRKIQIDILNRILMTKEVLMQQLHHQRCCIICYICVLCEWSLLMFYLVI